jgi:hypothetical protein
MFNKIISLLFFQFATGIYTSSYGAGKTYSPQAMAGLTLAKNSDFTASLTYLIATKVGTDVGDKERYVLHPRTVDPNSLEDEVIRFLGHVNAGRAFLNNAAVTSTTTSNIF